MGSNVTGQLGLSSASKGVNVPTLLSDLNFVQIYKVRAGSFSAALSLDGQLFVWGQGHFGRFDAPHRVKCGKKFDITDMQVSRAGLAALINKDGSVYTWGPNEAGQLGQGDYAPKTTPARVKTISRKVITQVAVGDDFVIALGQTFPMFKLHEDLHHQAKENNFNSARQHRLTNQSSKTSVQVTQRAQS
jgi:alpha-tubulin suppressor-like RCC1 family protein